LDGQAWWGYGRDVEAWASRMVERYWGYLFLAAAAVLALLDLWPFWVLAFAVAALVYLLAFAPLFCGAKPAEGSRCRKACRGLVLGCPEAGHRWQRLSLAVRPKRWDQLAASLFGSIRDGLGTLLLLAAIWAGAAAVVWQR
jgi:hypothetical protein